MTRIIDLTEVIDIGGDDNAVYFTKDVFNETDLLIAQDANNNVEDWFVIINSYTATIPLKSGYTMYVLKKAPKPQSY